LKPNAPEFLVQFLLTVPRLQVGSAGAGLVGPRRTGRPAALRSSADFVAIWRGFAQPEPTLPVGGPAVDAPGFRQRSKRLLLYARIDRSANHRGSKTRHGGAKPIDVPHLQATAFARARRVDDAPPDIKNCRRRVHVPEPTGKI